MGPPRSAKSKAIPSLQNTVPQSRLLRNALVDKENVQPYQGRESGPLLPRQPSAGLQGATSHDESATLAAVLRRMEQMEAQLQKEQEEKRKLAAAVELFQAGRQDGHRQEENTELGDESIDWHQKYIELQESASKSNPPDNNPTDEDMVPRPAGTPGKDWSLQVEMGLAGNSRRDAKYAALLRGTRDLVLHAGVNWEDGWREIPAADKSKLFQVARERHPILKRYVNDWATAEIIKQYLKNKRAHHYHNGWLKVPEKYAHLKQNSSKRNPNGSRRKQAKVKMAAQNLARAKELKAKHKNISAEVEMDDEESEESSDTGSNNES